MSPARRTASPISLTRSSVRGWRADAPRSADPRDRGRGRAGAKRIVLQTNGRRLAYRAYARELAAASRKLVLDVSLQARSEAMHEYHTQAPGSFKQQRRDPQRARGGPRGRRDHP